MKKIVLVLAMVSALMLALTGCWGDSSKPSPTVTPSMTPQTSMKPDSTMKPSHTAEPENTATPYVSADPDGTPNGMEDTTPNGPAASTSPNARRSW